MRLTVSKTGGDYNDMLQVTTEEYMMKKILSVLCLCLLAFSCSACDTTQDIPEPAPPSETPSSSDAATSEVSSTLPAASSETPDEPQNGARQIRVQFGENTVIYELNDSTAAASLYQQLPITLEVEDFSTNEKIFYPAQTLDTTDAPLAEGGAGTLAYYAPWGDVVMFYGDYHSNPALFELGHVVSGGSLISQMSGTITVSAIDESLQ